MLGMLPPHILFKKKMLPPHMSIFGLLINNVLRKQKFPFTLSLIYQVIPYVYQLSHSF